MNDRNLGPFFLQMLGKYGTYLPEAGSADTLICNAVFRTYYKKAKKISSTVALKQLSGESPIPKPVWRFYAKEEAWNANHSDTEYVISLCRSITRARLMQKHVHDWLPESGLSEATVAELDCHYIEKASFGEVTNYLAHVRHQLMLA